MRLYPTPCLLRNQLLQTARDTLLLESFVTSIAAPAGGMVLVVAASLSGCVLRDTVWGAHTGASCRVMCVQSLLGRGLRVRSLADLLMGVFDSGGL